MYTVLLSSFAILAQGSVIPNAIRSPASNPGTFQNPAAYIRPRFRYWVPDASVDLSRVSADISDAASIGAGGVELLGYYNYGDIESGAGIIETDWTVYGWGTSTLR